jgi:hypothetical protein
METPVEVRPERFSRQGEAMAWGLTILAMVGWGLIAGRGLRAPLLYQLISGFVTLTALSLSLTNWVDRSTVIRLDDEGVRFENGLRKVRLRWNEVLRVQVVPMNLGKLVRVVGARTYFTFRTLAEVSLHGKTRSKVGFAAGDQLLQEILERSGLHSMPPVDAGERPSDGYYYSRQ